MEFISDEMIASSVSGGVRPSSTIVLIPPDSPELLAASATSYDCHGLSAAADVPLLCDMSRATPRTPNAVPHVGNDTEIQNCGSGSGDSSCSSTAGEGCLLLCPPPTALQLHCSPFSSTQSSLQPVCRICQCSGSGSESYEFVYGPERRSAAGTDHQALISPCRCTGSLQYVHPKCLRKWIEVCQRRKCNESSSYGNRPLKQDACELCGYIFRKRTRVKVKGWKFPNVSTHDKCLHGTFFVCLLFMLGSVVAMVLCFAGNREHSSSVHQYLPLGSSGGRLSRDEVASLASGITFFASFFVAMVVEMKARRTIHQIVRRCIRHNTVWLIENYEAERRNAAKPADH